MSGLYDTVFPGIINVLQPLMDTARGEQDPPQPYIAGIAMGTTDSIPQSPWVWIEAGGFQAPEQAGSDREQTVWNVNIKLIHEVLNSQPGAEAVLAALIDPIRAQFRGAVKLRDGEGNPYPSVARARVTGGTWGYLTDNSVWYRYVDLAVSVVEKVALTGAYHV